MTRLSTIAILPIALAALGLARGQTDPVNKPRPITIIQEPVVEGTGDTWAVIEWTTSTGGNSIIRAGIHKSGLRQMAQTPQALHLSELPSYQEQEYTHRVSMYNLKPGTKYYFQADSGTERDSGIGSRSGISQFTTTATEPVATKKPIRIIGEPVARVGSTSAVISWTTNVKGSSTVQYSTDSNDLGRTASSLYPLNSRTHSVLVEHLIPGTRYFFVADSAQSKNRGKDAISILAQFTTRALAVHGVYADTTSATAPPAKP